MNYSIIFYIIGWILNLEAAFMLPSCLVALIYQESSGWSLVAAVLLCLLIGLPLVIRKPKNRVFYLREGFATTALCWIVLSCVGALPFVLSGYIPNPVDALFETVSGFTTTGASILTDVEALPHCLLFWRSFTHWVGGMGVLVFTMAVLPVSDGRAMHLMRAESPGPSVGKISSKIRDTAKILYAMYLVLTVVQTILLRLVGLPWYDALITAFGAAGTGGFSNRAASIGAYGSPAVEMITAVFMVLFGINFNVYFFLLIRHFKEAFACEEMRVYLGVIAASTLAVAGNIFHLYGNVWQSLRYSFFQVASIITTTGYATTDFNMWPTFSKAVLVLLMFFGACAGSTGGGIKTTTIFVLAQEIRCIFSKQRPGAFRRALPANAIAKASTIGLLGMLVVCCTTFLLCILEPGLPFISLLFEAVSAYSTAGLSTGITAQLCLAAKLVLIFTMYTGRVGAFTLLSLWVERPEPNAHFTEEAITIG